MGHRHIILLSCLGWFYTLDATICLPKGMTLEDAQLAIIEKRDQGLIEFAFDVHDTLLEKNTAEMKLRAFSYPNKWAVIANIFNFPIMAEAGYYAWHNALYLAPLAIKKQLKKSLNGELFLEFLERTKAEDLKNVIIDITNAQHIAPGMLELVESLYKFGYVLRIASNIKREIFDSLVAQFKEENKPLFDYFKTDSEGKKGKTLETHGIVYSPLKPDPRYFTEYINEYNPYHNKLIIFIDDRSDNIAQAVRFDMIGIHFQGVAALEQELILLGLLPSD